MWRSTVLGDRNNCAAMSFVDIAAASRSSTSTSRAVTPAASDARNLPTPLGQDDAHKETFWRVGQELAVLGDQLPFAHRAGDHVDEHDSTVDDTG